MTRWILAVSRRSGRSCPKPFIHGAWSLSEAAGRPESFSWRASVTKALRACPRSAAFALARRNTESGISRVVFTSPYSHIYGYATTEPERRPEHPPHLTCVDLGGDVVDAEVPTGHVEVAGRHPAMRCSTDHRSSRNASRRALPCERFLQTMPDAARRSRGARTARQAPRLHGPPVL